MFKYGNYVKMFNGVDGDSTIVTFCGNAEDNRYKTRQLLKNQNIEVNGDQTICSDETLDKFLEISFYHNDNSNIKKVHKHFNKLFYNFYNVWGQQVKEGILIQFDFENSKVKIGNKEYKVDRDREFTYKFLKTKIKAIDGIEGFYEFVLESMHSDSPFNGSFYGVLEKAMQ